MIRYILLLLLIFILCIYLQFKTIVYETFIGIKENLPASYLIDNTNVKSLLTRHLFSGTMPDATSYNIDYGELERATDIMWKKNYSTLITNSDALKNTICKKLYKRIKANFVSQFSDAISSGAINNDIPAYDSNWTYSTATNYDNGYFNKYFEPCCRVNEITYVWAKVSFVPYSESANNADALDLLDGDSSLGGTLRLGYVETWVDVNSKYLHEISGFSVTTTITDTARDVIIAQVQQNIPGGTFAPLTRLHDGEMSSHMDSNDSFMILHEGTAVNLASTYINDGVLTEQMEMAINGQEYGSLDEDVNTTIATYYLNGQYFTRDNSTTIEQLVGFGNELNHKDANNSKYNKVKPPPRRMVDNQKVHNYDCGSYYGKRWGIFEHVSRQRSKLDENLQQIVGDTDCNDLAGELYPHNANVNKSGYKLHKYKFGTACKGDGFAEACTKIKTKINAVEPAETLGDNALVEAALSEWKTKVITALDGYFRYCAEYNSAEDDAHVICSGRILIVTWSDGMINWYVAAASTDTAANIKNLSNVKDVIELNILSNTTQQPSRSEEIASGDIASGDLDKLEASEINEHRSNYEITMTGLNNTNVGKIFDKIESSHKTSVNSYKNSYFNDIKKNNKIPTFCSVKPGYENYESIIETHLKGFLAKSISHNKRQLESDLTDAAVVSAGTMVKKMGKSLAAFDNAEGAADDFYKSNQNVVNKVINALKF